MASAIIASSQVNLELTIPLYSGGAVSSRSRQAAYNYEASRQSLENQQRDTIRTVRNAYRGQETAISQIKALDQTRDFHPQRAGSQSGRLRSRYPNHRGCAGRRA
jgi:outer membrane protein TolC